MADQADVETALAGLAASALYPLGTVAASVTGGVVRVYRGWPANAALETDLAAGIAHVSVTAVPGDTQPVDQVPAVWEYPTITVPSLQVAAQGNTVAFSGTAGLGQLAGVLADDAAFAYRTRAGDTPDLVAASLCALVAQQRAAAVAGAVLTVPGTRRLIGRVVADQPALMQTRRQSGVFQMVAWCADVASRDAVAAAIDAACAGMPFLPLADGSVGRLTYVDTESTDELVPLSLYRRVLRYRVAYAATLAQTQPSMLFGLFENGPLLQLS